MCWPTDKCGPAPGLPVGLTDQRISHHIRAQVVRRQSDGSWLRLLDQPEFNPPAR